MRTSLIISFLLVLLVSCSSLIGDADAAKWYRCGVNFEKQKWRICDTEKDGISKDLKGFCYIDLECKKRILRKPKKRNKELYCAFTDKSCVQRLRDSGKILKKR